MAFTFDTSKWFASQMDAADPLAIWKTAFYFPQHNGRNVIYFCGNSLGLQPKRVANAITTELDSWQQLAVGGYFRGTNPWLYYHDYCKPALAVMMGCEKAEITVMNALTVNLHLMMLSFYRPTPGRYKIMMEAGAFPSDQYAVETQVKHWLPYLNKEINIADVIIEIQPRENERLLRIEDIIAAINEHGD